MHCFITLAKIPEHEGSISPSSFYGDLPGSESPQGFESFHSDQARARWHNLVCMECLWTIKSMVFGFCFIGS